MSRPKPFLDPHDPFNRLKELERRLKNLENTPRTKVAGTAVGFIATEENRTSTSYGDLATVGPTVSVPVGNSGTILVTVSCLFDMSFVDGNAGYMSFEVRNPSGSLVSGWSASDLHSAEYHISNDASDPVPSPPRSATFAVTGLSLGTYTIKAKYRCNPAITTGFINRTVVAVPI